MDPLVVLLMGSEPILKVVISLEYKKKAYLS